VANLVEEKSLLAMAFFVADAVVLGLSAREFAGTGPLDMAERTMQDGDAVQNARSRGEGAHLVEHGLAVFATAGVDEDDVVLGQV
jgi:hypothetical protein